MNALTLTPADTFFFKGHMMSEMGKPSQLSSLFPPRPNTVYGALRSAYIHKQATFEQFYQETNAGLKKWMGTPRNFGLFRQQALFLKRDQHILLPIPMDYRIKAVYQKPGDQLQAYPLQLIQNKAASHISVPFTLTESKIASEGKPVDHSGKYCVLEDWSRAVFAREEIQNIESLDNAVDSYVKTGIAINPVNRQAEDSHFYQMQMMTMKHDYALLSLSEPCPDFSDIPYVSLGAENRPWFLQQSSYEWKIWSSDQLLLLEKQLNTSCIARIILLTPLVFPTDFQMINKSKLWEIIPGVFVRLITWAARRTELFGGWDMARHRPKERSGMLPAGTVFYVEITEKDIPKMMDCANGFTLFSGQAEGRDMEGFGFSVIAGVEKNFEN